MEKVKKKDLDEIMQESLDKAPEIEDYTPRKLSDITIEGSPYLITRYDGGTGNSRPLL